MSINTNTISAIPTNIITGFLGVGKSTAILYLLKNKPDNERWAVLVNEFGEIGVDGSLFQGQHDQEQGVFIREVPGGCMCCAARFAYASSAKPATKNSEARSLADRTHRFRASERSVANSHHRSLS